MEPTSHDTLSTDTCNAARMYDSFFGGHRNVAIDWMVAEQGATINPDIPLIGRDNCLLLRQAVTFLGQQHFYQFFDIGSGPPTVGNVHEVAQKANPHARDVCVDNDGIAVRQSQAILHGNANASVIQANARAAVHLLNHPDVQRLLDFNQLIAVLSVAMLHVLTDAAEVYNLIYRLHAAMMPGSYLVLSYGLDEGLPPEFIANSERIYSRSTNSVKVRSGAASGTCFGGFELVEPNVGYVPYGAQQVFLTCSSISPSGPDSSLMWDANHQANAGATLRMARAIRPHYRSIPASCSQTDTRVATL